MDWLIKLIGLVVNYANLFVFIILNLINRGQFINYLINSVLL